ALYQFGDMTCNYVAANGHSAAELLRDADQRLIDLQAGHLTGRVASLRETTAQLLEDLEYRVQHRGELLGLDTGYASINELTCGWQPGDLVVIGARPSIGKTTFLLNTAVASATAIDRTKSETAVLLFSFEMRRRQLEYRLLSQLSRIPLSQITG